MTYTQTQPQIVDVEVQEIDVQVYKNGNYIDVSLPAKTVTINTNNYQWQNPKDTTEILLNSGFTISNTQLSEAGKTVQYTLQHPMLKELDGIPSNVMFDAEYLAARNNRSLGVNQYVFSVSALLSAKPNVNPVLTGSLMRVWCANGAMSIVKGFQFPQLNVFGKEPLEIQIERAIAQLPATVDLEAQIHEVLVPETKSIDTLSAWIDFMGEYLVKPKRGAELPAFPNSRMANNFNCWRAMPDWAVNDSFDLFQAMHSQLVDNRQAITLEMVENAVTTPLFNGGMNNRRGQNGAYVRNANAYVGSVADWFAYRAN